MDLIKVAEEAFATGKQHPEFGPGDTITVAYRIKELSLIHIFRSFPGTNFVLFFAAYADGRAAAMRSRAATKLLSFTA